jgi:heterodisulfide reductase subunit A
MLAGRIGVAERIGFYICHCGINISFRVRVEEVADYVRTLRNVVVSRHYLFMCSDPGKELIENDIREQGLTSVVVASCSPRMHEMTFRGACERAGLNPYRAFHMVCVREHVSWVTQDEDEATEKAKLLSGRRHVTATSTTYRPSSHPSTLIIGWHRHAGGARRAAPIRGSSGAVATIGGHAQYDKTFRPWTAAALIPRWWRSARVPHRAVSTARSRRHRLRRNFGRVQRRHVTDVDKCTDAGCEAICPVQFVPLKPTPKLRSRGTGGRCEDDRSHEAEPANRLIMIDVNTSWLASSRRAPLLSAADAFAQVMRLATCHRLQPGSAGNGTRSACV